MTSIPFSDEDFAINEGLGFSAAQKMRLQPKIELYIALSAIGALVCFLFASILFFVGTSSAASLFFMQIGSIIGFGIFFYGIFWSLGVSNRVKKGYGVKKVEGKAEMKIHYSGDNNDVPDYVLKIADVKFSLTEEMYDAFAEKEFRIYYFPLVKNIILSAEPLD